MDSWSRGGRCGIDEVSQREYQWKYAGGEAIEVGFIDDPFFGTDRWRITPGEDCNQLHVQHWYAYGEEWLDADPWPRGEVCVGLEPCGPDSIECFCQSRWCDEPPPMCAAEP